MKELSLMAELGLDEQKVREKASRRLKEAIETLAAEASATDTPSDFDQYNFSAHSQHIEPL